jgi:NitT/TauT family transport system substrate-binding protein
MSLLTRIARATALIAILLATPALAENKKVTLSQAFQSMLYLPLYVAIDEGFFTQQGLDLTKETAGAPTVALSAVISGSAQFSIHGPEWTAIAASKGAPVNIIANVVNGAAVWIATAPDFKFDSIKDVKGQKVVTGLMPTTSTSLFMKLLKENGMDPKTDVEMIQVAIGSEPGPFVAKQANIAVMYEPGLHEGRSRISEVLRCLCILHRDRAERCRSRHRATRGQRNGNGNALHDQERSQDGRNRQKGISDA